MIKVSDGNKTSKANRIWSRIFKILGTIMAAAFLLLTIYIMANGFSYFSVFDMGCAYV